MEQDQREYILKEYRKLIDAYDSTTNKYAAIAAILLALVDLGENYIYTADGYEDYRIAAVESVDIRCIAGYMNELGELENN
jgi:hypothetical protein